MNKAQRAAVARQARVGGYFDKGRTLEVTCPLCRQCVVVDKYSGLSVARLLDGGMLAHLEECLDK